jgi:hypothetical protein
MSTDDASDDTGPPTAAPKPDTDDDCGSGPTALLERPTSSSSSSSSSSSFDNPLADDDADAPITLFERPASSSSSSSSSSAADDAIAPITSVDALSTAARNDDDSEDDSDGELELAQKALATMTKIADEQAAEAAKAAAWQAMLQRWRVLLTAPFKQRQSTALVEVRQYLDDIPSLDFYSRMDTGTRLRIARHLELQERQPGDVLCAQGEPGDYFYVITEGEADVYLAKRTFAAFFVCVLRPSLFGRCIASCIIVVGASF